MHRAWIAVVAALSLAGCFVGRTGTGALDGGDGPGLDARVDAAVDDAGDPVDADAALDAGPTPPRDGGPPDGGTDAGDGGPSDAGGPDGGTDAGPPADAGTDAGPPSDAGMDAGPPDAGSDAGCDPATFTPFCDVDDLVDCVAGGLVSTPCPFGCAAPVCRALVPANVGSRVAMDAGTGGLAVGGFETIRIDTDTGRVWEPGFFDRDIRQESDGVGLDPDSGIYYERLGAMPAGGADLGVFVLGSLSVPSTGRIEVVGDRALVLLVGGDVLVEGALDASADDRDGGPGAGDGGDDGDAGAGAGGGGGGADDAAKNDSGGGGGAYGSGGGAGGRAS
ncbi:MAG TPA: hypothetical protein RMH99_18920, partial [Sandaracinaceae bacterium LLY-WYZ-13_1]|nr:hypothetical protein [Sandaracinaceae bacterium LLY-WYZ-13_1]